MIENRFRSWYVSEATRPLILAHRGDSFRAPENTLEAARLGFETGADGWELDVRLTLDGVPVVIHDESLLRTTDVARRFEGDPRGASGYLVGDFLLEEIRSLDAGSWFVDPLGGPRTSVGFGSDDRIGPEDRARYRSGSVRVPTLLEALELTLERDWMVNVEIKASRGPTRDVVEAVHQMIVETGSTARVALSSFDHEMVRWFHWIEPEVATGALVWGSMARWREELSSDPSFDALHADAESILGFFETGSDLLPKRLKAGLLPVMAYTVNDAGPSGQADRLAQGGVSGLFTDDPAGLTGGSGPTPSGERTRSR